MQASFGKIVITQPDGAAGKPMAGYSRNHFCQGVLDDVHARGVLIEDIVLGNVKKRLLLISLDFLKIPMKIADYIKEKIQEKADFGLGPGQILIHAIHTHSAPDLTGEFFWPGGVDKVIKGIMFGANRNDRYIVWMANQVVKMVRQMILDLRPCKLAWGKQIIDAEIMLNRRHPIRESKQNLSVISFKDSKTNELFGILTSYGMHPTTLARENEKLSADYPGRVCYKIEELGQGKVSAAFFTGAAGDLNPITTCGTDYDTLENDAKARNTVYEQHGTYEETTRLGFHLGEQAFQLANNISDDFYYDGMEFKAYVKKFWIPFEDYQPFVYNWGNWITNKFTMFVKKWFLFPIALNHPVHQEPNFPGLAIKAFPFKLRKGYHINVYTVVHYINIAFTQSESINSTSNKTKNSKKTQKTKNFTIFGVPGELFEDVEKRILNKSPTGPENTLIIQNANDWCAYLFPITEYITQAGYEPFASTTPIAGDRVEKELYLLMKEEQEAIQLGYW